MHAARVNNDPQLLPIYVSSCQVQSVVLAAPVLHGFGFSLPHKAATAHCFAGTVVSLIAARQAICLSYGQFACGHPRLCAQQCDNSVRQKCVSASICLTGGGTFDHWST